jgi:hypothetical protein
MHCALPKPTGRDALGYPSTRSSSLITSEILSKQPGPPLHSTETLPPTNWRAGRQRPRLSLDQSIAEALVIAFTMIVDDEFRDGTTQRFLPHEDHPVQAFFLVRAHEALRIRITPRRQLQLVRLN